MVTYAHRPKVRATLWTMGWSNWTRSGSRIAGYMILSLLEAFLNPWQLPLGVEALTVRHAAGRDKCLYLIQKPSYNGSSHCKKITRQNWVICSSALMMGKDCIVLRTVCLRKREHSGIGINVRTNCYCEWDTFFFLLYAGFSSCSSICSCSDNRKNGCAMWDKSVLFFTSEAEEK
jgi:hypothetical protein